MWFPPVELSTEAIIIIIKIGMGCGILLLATAVLYLIKKVK
jgi:hypothetical protein